MCLYASDLRFDSFDLNLRPHGISFTSYSSSSIFSGIFFLPTASLNASSSCGDFNSIAIISTPV